MKTIKLGIAFTKSANPKSFTKHVIAFLMENGFQGTIQSKYTSVGNQFGHELVWVIPESSEMQGKAGQFTSDYTKLDRRFMFHEWDNLLGFSVTYPSVPYAQVKRKEVAYAQAKSVTQMFQVPVSRPVTVEPSLAPTVVFTKPETRPTVHMEIPKSSRPTVIMGVPDCVTRLQNFTTKKE